MSVFRSKGYDGASLNELAEATGLKKASLLPPLSRREKGNDGCRAGLYGSLDQREGLYGTFQLGGATTATAKRCHPQYW